VGGLSGFLAVRIGWVPFYLFTALATMPSMALMLLLLRRYPPAPTNNTQKASLTEDMAI
jgi:PAT family beta-lactamase induction signal transducer AmpG